MTPSVPVVAALALTQLVASAAEFKIGAHNFTLPEGFTVEKVAGPGIIDRPIVADFDEQGRLYVAESSGSNDPVNKQLIDKPHRIVRLEDLDADGIFDKAITFADKMMFPEGAMWLDGSLYVSAPPVIWKLTDTDGDGVADKREEWFDAKTLTGCANDLHGPYLGPDGWIYWCKGAFAKQTYERPGSVPFETRAAHIFRRRPEGGIVEPVMTGGMDNPVDVTFTPEGERIFTTTFFQHPGGGQRDGLVHAIYGGVYGKVHDVIDDHKKTGELMPVLTHLGPAAPAGLTRYESEIFGSEYRDNLFAALFNLHKVTRHILKPAGATYTTVDSDFLVSDNTDFHSTDVIEDADGSLLVIDTGGWYKLCCPTSQLWKPDVLGAIYRIRRTGAPKVEDPRGLKIDWDKATPQELADLLADARPAVAKRAIQNLRTYRSSARVVLERVLTGEGPERQKINAVWALASSNDTNAVSVLHGALRNGMPPSVQQAALHARSVYPDKAWRASARTLLSTFHPPQVRRAAAEMLGRSGEPRVVPDLLRAAGRLTPSESGPLPDRVEEHSIIYALIEINAAAETRTGLGDANAFTRRAALIALDQMSSEALKPSDVIPLLTSSDPVLKETANWIIPHRKDWGADLAQHFERRLKSDLSAADKTELTDQLIKLASSSDIQDLVARVASAQDGKPAEREFALHVMSRAAQKETPARWAEVVTDVLEPGNSPIIADAVGAAANFRFKQFPADLRRELGRISRSEGHPISTRLEALAAISSGSKLDGGQFDLTRTQLAPGASTSDRRRAISILSRAALSDEQLAALGAELEAAGPLEISHLLAAYEKSISATVGTRLLGALKDATSFSSLTADQIQRTFAKYPAEIKTEAAQLAASLNVDLAEQSARIEQLLPRLQNGDIRRGQSIFNSAKAACSSCHAIGYLGGDLGPDLTRIGQVRTERDLLEAILYPSASFVRSYEPLILSTREDEVYSGVLRKDASDEIILATGPGVQVRIPRGDVIDSRPGKVSVMPQGLDQQLTTQELADLLAFLKATRW